MTFWGFHMCLLVTLVQVFVTAGLTDPNDFASLQALKTEWENVPLSWIGGDPCGNHWAGISCSNSRIISIECRGFDLIGKLSSDITKLSELQILDLSYNKGMTGPLPRTIGNLNNLTSLNLIGCGFSSQIPPSIGSLQQLVYLSLNSNNFIGEMPTSIGNLVNLYWLDLAGNKLSGCIPVSGESTPGLNMLLNAKHFHFGNNMLSCEIPPQLFSSDMSLTHLLLEGNQLTGSIPSTLGLMQTLEVVRLDKNSLSGPVPDSLTHLISINHLYLANNQLDGPIPDLTGMKSLNYVDMSNNSFSPTDIPAWFSSLRSLTTLIMENTQLRGNLPTDLFSHDELQTVILKNNGIKGTLTIGSLHSTQLKLIDLQNNSFDGFTEQANAYDFQIVLADNPICKKRGTKKYCTIFQPDNIFISTGKRFVCYSIVFIYNIVLLLTSGPRGDNVYLNEKVDTLYVTQMTELYNQCDQLYLRSTLSHL